MTTHNLIKCPNPELRKSEDRARECHSSQTCPEQEKLSFKSPYIEIKRTDNSTERKPTSQNICRDDCPVLNKGAVSCSSELDRQAGSCTVAMPVLLRKRGNMALH